MNIILLKRDSFGPGKVPVSFFTPWSFRQTDPVLCERYSTQQDNWFEIDPTCAPWALSTTSISIGIAVYPSADITRPDQLPAYADKALYRAKELGCNRVVLFNAAETLMGG